MTLAEFMAERGLKDDDLTEALGVGRSMVTKLRLRIAKPSYDVMHRLNAFANGAVTVPEMEPIERVAGQQSEAAA
jgi:transcriptional regulator with XRE-family HTH domain